MARVLTARQFGEEVGLEHLEVIRRIRKGDIRAEKFGWNWTIKEDEVAKTLNAPWYKGLMQRRQQHSATS